MPLTDVDSLLALQEVDLKIRDMESRLKLLPKEMQSLIDRRDALLKDTASAADRARQVELEAKNTENAIAGLEAENRKLQQQSGMVKKNAEYQALLSAVETNRKKIGELEEKTLLLFDELETARARAAKVREDNAQTIRNIKSEFDELFAFSKTVETELARLKKERPDRLCGIDPETLSLYTRLLNAKNVRTPVSKVEAGVCGNCHLRVTPQCLNHLKRDRLAVCDNCQGLLYLDENAD